MSAPEPADRPRPRAQVVNPAYLDLWREHFHIVEDPGLVRLFFLFSAFAGTVLMATSADGSPGDWTELGGRGQIAWDEAGNGPWWRYRSACAQPGTRAQEVRARYGRLVRRPTIRTTGFHRRAGTRCRRNRNAALEINLPRSGRSPSAADGHPDGRRVHASLPKMERVIDYPHSGVKTPELDIYLAATARFFLGTTSGWRMWSSAWARPVFWSTASPTIFSTE